jgi:hypothetical protein
MQRRDPVIRVSLGLLAAVVTFIAATIFVGWIMAFRNPPAMFVDAFYWMALGHVVFALTRLTPARLVFACSIFCFIGLVAGSGVFT